MSSDNSSPSASQPELPNTVNAPPAGSAPYLIESNQQAPPYPTSDAPPSSSPPSLPYPNSNAPSGSPPPVLPYPTSNTPAVSAPPSLSYPNSNAPSGSPPPVLPYPTSNTPAVSASPALPYPTSNDPAYPPAAPPASQGVPPGESTPMILGTTSPPNEEKQPVLPPYSAPPPSYMDTYPEMQQQMQPPSMPRETLYPPGGIPAQYVAPQPQDMVRINGSTPCQIECPKCHQQIVTNTRYQSGILVYLAALMCILFGGVLGCCLIPFCISGLKDVYHTCPNCKHPIGRYDRLS